jgi:PKD domain
MASGNGMLDVRRMGTVGRIVLGVVLLLAHASVSAATVMPIGSGGTSPGQFDIPAGVAVAADGSIYTADWTDGRVQHLDAEGHPIAQWSALPYAIGLAVAANGDVYVLNWIPSGSWKEVHYFSPTGGPLGSWTVPSATANCLAADTHDHLYTIAGGVVTQYSESGTELGTTALSATSGGDGCLAVTSAGGFVVTNDVSNSVTEYDPGGTTKASWSAFYPQGVAVNSQGHVFVGVGNGEAVEAFSEAGTPEGRVQLRPSTGGFRTNYNKVALASDGLLYSTDPSGNLIWRLDTAPTPSIAASPGSGLTSQTVTFDASRSSIDIGVVVDYRWDLDGSGTYATDTGTTATLAQRFDSPGTYRVGLQVTAADGEAAGTTLDYIGINCMIRGLRAFGWEGWAEPAE